MEQITLVDSNSLHNEEESNVLIQLSNIPKAKITVD
jgi:hypothetical protein